MSYGDLLLDLQQERPKFLIDLHSRNGGRFSGNIVGGEGSAPYQQETGADRYWPPRRTRCTLAPPRQRVRGEAKLVRMEPITKHELEH